MARFSTRLLQILLISWGISACDAGSLPAGAIDGDAGTADIMAHDASQQDADGPAPGDFPLQLGTWADDGEGFDAFTEGQTVSIVHGSQGGIHVFAAFELDLGADAWTIDTVAADIEAALIVDDEVAASTELSHFYLQPVDHGVFRSSTLLVVFHEWDAALWDGREARLWFDVAIPATGETASAVCDLILADDDA